MLVYVVGRHRWRGLLIGVCRKGVVETVGERPKKRMCAMDRMSREGEGVCMHERKLVVATKVRGLRGCKRLTKIIIGDHSVLNIACMNIAVIHVLCTCYTIM